MFCLECGKEIPNESRFCLYCGQRITPVSFTGDFVALSGATVIQAHSVVMESKLDKTNKKDKAVAPAHIIYCVNCGLKSGQPDSCIHPEGHRFSNARINCSIVYCRICAMIPGGSTQCLSNQKHAFVEASDFCITVYCARCGVNPSTQQACIDERGHQFVESPPDKGYCYVCGKLNTIEGTFKCPKCYSSFICLSHQDSKWSTCKKCASTYKHRIMTIGGKQRCVNCGKGESAINYSNIDACLSHEFVSDQKLFCRKCGKTIDDDYSNGIGSDCDCSTGPHSFIYKNGHLFCNKCGQQRSDGYYDHINNCTSTRSHSFVALKTKIVCEKCGHDPLATQSYAHAVENFLLTLSIAMTHVEEPTVL
jgi:hypothetical protein